MPLRNVHTENGVSEWHLTIFQGLPKTINISTNENSMWATLKNFTWKNYLLDYRPGGFPRHQKIESFLI